MVQPHELHSMPTSRLFQVSLSAYQGKEELHFKTAHNITSTTILLLDLPTLYLTDPDLVQEVLVTHYYKYSKPGFLQLLIPPLGNSLLTSNGKEHAWQRKMLNPAFSYAHLKGMVPFMKTAGDNLVQVRK